MKKITAWILCIVLVFSIAAVWAFWASSIRVVDDTQKTAIQVGSTAPVETQISLWEELKGFNDDLILVPTGGAIMGTTAEDATVVEFVLFPIVLFWNKLPNGETTASYDPSLEGLAGQFLFEINISLLENDNNLGIADDPIFAEAQESIVARLLVIDDEQEQAKWPEVFNKFEQTFRSQVQTNVSAGRNYTYSSDINNAISELEVAETLEEITEHYKLSYWKYIQMVLVIYLEPPTSETIIHIVNAPVLVKISVSLDDDHEVFSGSEISG